MLWLVPTLFGIGCLIAMYQARGDGLRLSMALALTIVWASANLMWLGNMVPLIMLLDFVMGLAALLAWVERHSRWATQLVVLCYLRLAAHAMFEMTGGVFLVPFIHAINALFTLKLIVVSMPGGIHGLNRLFRVFRFGHYRHSGVSAFRTQEH